MARRAAQAIDILYNSFDEIREFPMGCAGKPVIRECRVKIGGTKYFRRDFSDGGSELVRYDFGSGKWVFLLFKGDGENVQKAV